MKNIIIRYTSGVALLFGFATVPLPAFDGNPTGLRLGYQLYASKHIASVSEFVIGLDEIANDKDNNGEAINSAEFEYFIHASQKPKPYEYNVRDEYLDAVEDWREERKDLKIKIKELKSNRSDLVDRRRTMVAASPIKKFWTSE
tara:strand:- start:235 stop:666 length:432 start_codon:yes stop_codon:yes gene_type:complete